MPPRLRAILLALLPLLAGCKQRALPSGEVHVEAKRLAASKARTPEEIAPYDEALAWHEYEVQAVKAGKLQAKKIRVAHWTVIKGKAVPVSTATGETALLKLRPFENTPDLESLPKRDDLELDLEGLPRYVDVGQALAQADLPKVTRLDYGGNFSNAMKLYWQLRPQLRLVVTGNSHAAKSVCPSMFWPEENSQTPVAFNLTPAGSNNHLQCELVKHYILPLPKLEWIVWVVSARNYNKLRVDDKKMKEFFASPGFLYDQKNHATLWPVPSGGKPMSEAEVRAIPVDWIDPWGWEGRQKSLLDRDPAVAKPKLLAELADPYFELDTTALDELAATLAEASKKARILLLSTPNHPVAREALAADPDHTTHDGRKQFVAAVQAIDAKLDRVWYRDFDQAGGHDFKHEEFYDADHLNRSGSRRMTDMILTWMDEVGKSRGQ